MKKRDDLTSPHNAAAGMAIIIVVLLIIFGGILYWMYSVKLLILPDFVTNIFGLSGNDSNELLPWDTEALAGAVRNGKSTDKVEVTFDVTYESLRSALLSEPKPEGIYQNIRVSYYHGDSINERRIIFMRWNDRFKVQKYSNDSFEHLSEVVIGDSKTVNYYNEDTGLYRSIPLPDDYYPENEAGLPSIESLLEILAQFPETNSEDTETDASDTTDEIFNETSEESAAEPDAEISPDAEPRYSECELMLLYSENGNVYYLSFYDNQFGTREEYYISLDLLMIAEHNTYFNDELLYSCKTLSFSTDPHAYGDEAEYSLSVK